MLSFVFKARINLFDASYIGLVLGLMQDGHWLTALATFISGTVLSTLGEAALARSQAKWS